MPSHSRTADSTTEPNTVRTLALGWVRLLADLAILALWTVFLTLLFLGTAWPRWAFYAILVGGAAAYVAVTAPWIRTSEAARRTN